MTQEYNQGEYATLRELNVKPGDVVENNTGSRKIIAYTDCDECCMESGATWKFHNPIWRIVSRASDTPKLWRDMTPEEKGALLLAKHEGKRIQCFHEGEWVNIYKPPWVDGVAYRVKPEEKRETFHMYGHNQYFGFYQCAFHTHRITFDLVDGEPDPSSIKMEKITK